MEITYFVGIFCVIVPLICGFILRFFRIGFYTEASQQSDETWAYAHKLSGNFMLIYSAVTIPIFTVFLVLFHNFFYIQYPYMILIFGVVSDLISGILMVVVTQIKTIKFGMLIYRKKLEEDKKASDNEIQQDQAINHGE